MKLTDIVVELGKVQTAKDRPAFKTPQQIEENSSNGTTPKDRVVDHYRILSQAYHLYTSLLCIHLDQ